MVAKNEFLLLNRVLQFLSMIEISAFTGGYPRLRHDEKLGVNLASLVLLFFYSLDDSIFTGLLATS